MNNTTAIPIYASEVSSLCADFVELRRATGLKYIPEEKILRQFSRHCDENFPGCIIPEDAIYNWVNGGTNQSLRTRYGKANVLAQWAKYLFSLGYTPLWIPTVRFTNNTGFVPHIFSAAEMQKIWSTVDHLLPSKIYPNMHRCIPTLFRLLYGCGLRISEALQITLRDIDFSTNVITLRHTKLDKERLVPMSDSVAKAMKTYADWHGNELGADDPFFFYRKGFILTSGSVYGRFRMTLQNSGIPYMGKLRGPRLHDFRHTFAVSAMNNLSDAGNDLYVILPILSAYLGHAGITSTERYIRLTEERLSTITDRIQIQTPGVFPEVEDDAEF